MNNVKPDLSKSCLNCNYCSESNPSCVRFMDYAEPKVDTQKLGLYCNIENKYAHWQPRKQTS